ncbi:iron ABC transporter permease [Chitinibacter fontanus]|uniref:Iron ABC transporter permease n=1 Tax=Chitinibacter fontanus TaxID=1737446 RepID=A0A7D5VBB3_9NEIS|nr:iron ABC transporter permease [Chitinibacter fontanus]QLI82594.1 iron ABC transporter permease [Chitinibacter fontanus]
MSAAVLTKPHSERHTRSPAGVTLLLAFCLLLLLMLSLVKGAVSIPLQALPNMVWGDIPAEQVELTMWQSLLIEVRLPRALFAALAGGVLALTGVLAQALFRNPLAEPALVGMVSGGALGAVSIIVLGGGSFLLLAPAAFIGSLITTVCAYHLGRRYPGVAGLLLAGVAINAICFSLIGLFTYWADETQLRTLTFWNMGSLAGARWSLLAWLTPWLLAGSLLALRYWRGLNALLLGEREALHLGFPIKALRRQLIVLMALLVGPLVAATGGIGFIGLVVPHLLRMILGADHRHLLPAAMLGGACALVAADWLARIVVMPAELPIGIVTSLIGGPFFLYLLIKGRPA